MQPLDWNVPNKNVDEISLGTHLRQIKNGFMDESKAIHKRPGLKLFADLQSGKGIDGKYSWAAKEMEVCVSNTNVYAITSDTGTVTTLGLGLMQLDSRVSFVEIFDITNNELRLFMANGGDVIWTNGVTTGTVSGALTPKQCKAITSIDTYLLALSSDVPYGFVWSVVGDPTNFGTGAGSHSSQLFSEQASSIGVNNDKLYVFSSSYIEVYYSTGDAVPFAPVPGGVLNYGISGPYATAYLADIIFVLNPERDVVAINNFSMNILSGNYAKFIQELSVVSDVEFDLVKGYGGRKWLLMTFKDANITIVYDIVSKAFYEWGTWNGVSDDKFDGRCYSFNPVWDKHLIGSRSSSLIYEIDVNTYTDNGNPIHTEITTAHYNPANFDFCNSEKLLIDVKCGVTTGEAEILLPTPTRISYSGEPDIEVTDVIVGSFGTRARFVTPSTTGMSGTYLMASSEPSYNISFSPIIIDETHFELWEGSYIIAYAGAATGFANRPLSPALFTFSTPHNLVDGDEIIISGTTNYNGNYIPAIISSTSFTIPVAFAGDEISSIVIVKMVPNEFSFFWQKRDNRETPWSNQVEITLRREGATAMHDPLFGLGRYRTRQHRITHQDNSEFVVNRIMEHMTHE